MLHAGRTAEKLLESGMWAVMLFDMISMRGRVYFEEDYVQIIFSL